jgi:hypothetical protein
MKPGEWRRLVRPLLSEEWRPHKSRKLAHLVPVDWVLHGIMAEGSVTGQFYLRRLHMPLTVPADGVIDLTYSPRHGRGSQTYPVDGSDTPRVLTEAMTLVEKEAGAPSVLPSEPAAEDIRGQEVRAYELLLGGDPGAALHWLDRVGGHDSQGFDWMVEVMDRAEEMRALVQREQTSEALHRLRTWRAENLESLGIPESPTRGTRAPQE